MRARLRAGSPAPFPTRAARSLRTFNPVTCKPRQPGTAEMPESQARPIITVVQHKSGMWARSLNQAEREMFERLQCALASCQFTCMAPQLQSTITCPNCGYQATEVMPTDACVALYDCNGCGETLKPIWFANPLTASHSRRFFSALRGRAKRQAAPPETRSASYSCSTAIALPWDVYSYGQARADSRATRSE